MELTHLVWNPQMWIGFWGQCYWCDGRIHLACRTQDDTSVIHIPLPFWEGSWQFGWLLLQSPPWRGWPLWGWWVTPWLLHWSLHKHCPGTENRLSSGKTPVGWWYALPSCWVLEWSSWSSFNLLCMMLVAASIGTEVNSAETSYEVMISSAWSMTCLICSMKSPVFLMWWGELPTRGFKILANSLATS